MEFPRHVFKVQKAQCILASALLGTATMMGILAAALSGAPEATIVAICVGGFGAMLTAAFVSHYCR
ncbi:MAG: hypothetical protein K0R39_3472 [Symbiobacteriaceae bacterium]|jgi:hypothetical protein|nr:hypothetical protein [Symbiobacteriaceae bacterium]